MIELGKRSTGDWRSSCGSYPATSVSIEPDRVVVRILPFDESDNFSIINLLYNTLLSNGEIGDREQGGKDWEYRTWSECLYK
jgi:hypothetical protein